MTKLRDRLIDVLDLEKAISECGHLQIDGRCFKEVKATIGQAQIAEERELQGMEDWLIRQGFDLRQEIQREDDIFMGASTYFQLQPVECPHRKEQHETRTIEGMRKWMKAGCPVN